MAKTPADVLIGITEFGEVTDPYGTPADVSWGATEQNGVELAFNGSSVDIQSGQSKVLEEMYLSSQTIDLTVRLQYSNLLNVARALGVADSVVTGDHSIFTPTPEILEPLATAIGTREFYLYAITPGPISTRRFEFKRCKVAPGGNISLAANAPQLLVITYRVLRPKQAGETNKPFIITDAV